MRAERVTAVCANCGKDFRIPPCRVWREKSCSTECKNQFRAKEKAASESARTRSCRCCGRAFVARQGQLNAGQGIYCSARCSLSAGTLDAGRTPEAHSKRVASWRQSFLEGRVSIKAGPEHPQWTGGKDAVKARQNTPEGRKAKADRLRRYRRLNPEKVREFTNRRKALRGKGAKLPAGTIARLLVLQKGRCAVCAVSVSNGYHLDHIYPISKGGTHTPDNVQILCPACNLKKNAKHPIAFMQERGMLL